MQLNVISHYIIFFSNPEKKEFRDFQLVLRIFFAVKATPAIQQAIFMLLYLRDAALHFTEICPWLRLKM